MARRAVLECAVRKILDCKLESKCGAKSEYAGGSPFGDLPIHHSHNLGRFQWLGYSLGHNVLNYGQMLLHRGFVPHGDRPASQRCGSHPRIIDLNRWIQCPIRARGGKCRIVTNPSLNRRSDREFSPNTCSILEFTRLLDKRMPSPES
jgi:hypothetical protein